MATTIELGDAAITNLIDGVKALRNEIADGVSYMPDSGRDHKTFDDLQQLLGDVESVEESMGRQLATTLLNVRSAMVEPTALDALLTTMKTEDELTKLRNRLDVILKPIEVNYKLTIHTGDEPLASSSANVFVTLYGVYENSGDQPITNGHPNLGGCSVTSMIQSRVLFELTKLCVRHDNAGLAPGWFLEKILVEDQLTDQLYEFVYNDWLNTDTLSVVLEPSL